MSDPTDFLPHGVSGLSEDSSLGLSAADSAALDALLEADMQLDRVAESIRARAQRIGALLGLLDANHITCDAALVDVTLQRIARHAEPMLSADDAEALDAWALSGYEASATPTSLHDRASRHQRLAEIVRESDIVATPLLVERTFQAVASQVAANRAQGIITPTSRGWRISDLISVAAMVLIGVSILWPTMSYVSQKGRQFGCKSNLGSVASAMGLYAGNHRDSLPVATAGFGGAPWWDVSPAKPQANSANLFTLARTGYSKLRDLACSGNPNAVVGEVKQGTYDWPDLDSISYSYQIMAGEQRPNWCGGQKAAPVSIVLLADRSPVVLRAVRKQVIDPMENSPNHGGTGQYALFADGSVSWMTTPERPDGDNIWLPRAIEAMIQQAAKFHQSGRLEGFEIPVDARDSFVGP
ncbi:MAG: hypothetical protein KF805_10890 [Phycisphaeraceae bacterium]|nr:hypothetical protein [Phycisphaeraceae bacterium]